MTSPFPKYTNGQLGPKSNPLSFDHINRLTSAAQKVEDMADDTKASPSRRWRSFVVELVEQAGSFAGRPYWSWRAVGVSGTAIAHQGGQIASEQYGAAAGGYAISLNGSGGIGDIVTIHEIPAFDGKRWFAFGAGGGGSTSGAVALDITFGTGNFPIQYQVVEGSITASGNFSPTGQGGIMWNLYEFGPYGHGQDLDFLSGSLTPAALSGKVFGGLSMIDGATRVNICDVPNPMTPTCGASPGGFGGQAQASSNGRYAADVLRNGL
jgi:hypothetical protein